MPDVPTFAEQGFPDLMVDEWFAFFAPARSQKEQYDKWGPLIKQVGFTAES